VLRGRGDDLERGRPFRPFVEAIGDHPRVAALLAGSESAGPASLLGAVPQLQYRVVDALVEALDDVARDRPLVVALDDLQWTDPSTLSAVGAICRRAPRSGIAVILAMRPTPRPRELQSLLRDVRGAGARRVHLAPIDGAELATARLGAPPAPALRRALDRCGGNPMFVIELLHTAELEGRLRRAGDEVELVDGNLPASLIELIGARREQLVDGGRELLSLASIFGSAALLDDITELAGWDTVDARRTLRGALATALVLPADEAITFRHDIVREAAYRSLAGPLRASLHRQAGLVLAARGAPPLDVARQLSLGAMKGDVEAVQWLHRAAIDASAPSPEVALALLERARELETAPSDERRALSAELQAWVGDLAESERQASDLLAATNDPMIRLGMRRHLALVCFLGGRADESALHMEAVLETAPQDQRPRVSAELALLRLAAADTAGAAAAADAVLGASTEAVDHTATSLALSVRSRLLGFRLDYDEARSDGQRATAVADDDPTGEADRYVPRLFVGLTLHDLDRLDETRAVVAEGRRRARLRGLPWAEPLYHALAAFAHLRSGAIGDATAEAEAGVLSGLEAGTELAAVWNQALLGLAAHHAGDEAVTRARTAWASSTAAGKGRSGASA
jgi:hypothetical protein